MRRAEVNATRSTRIDSTPPPLVFGATVASPLSTACAAGSLSVHGVGLAPPASGLAVRPVHLDDLDAPAQGSDQVTSVRPGGRASREVELDRQISDRARSQSHASGQAKRPVPRT